MWVRQCDLDAQADCPLPIPSRIASNEEFIPPVQTPEQARYEARLCEISDQAARKQGIDRRAFLRTGSGMAAALVALNEVFGPCYDVSAAEDTVTVTATGSQWSWEIAPQQVPMGRPVIFKVTSNDVNHGFGVYDPDGTMVFQTQAMPGYVNEVRYIFTKPGQYRVLCMEYCGLVHHDMIDKIEVK